MSKPILQICTPASPATQFMEDMKYASVEPIFELIQSAVGDSYRLRGNPALITAPLDESKAGRQDDKARVRELQRALADDNVAAIVTLRGGSWLTRLLPDIDFDVIDKRTRPIAIFGFSEITTLANIIGSYRMGHGYYDLGPAFLFSGMRRHARLNAKRIFRGKKLSGKALDKAAHRWAAERFEKQFADFFRDMVDMIEGRGSSRKLTGRLVHGKLPAESRAKVVGGCLTLVNPLFASPFVDRLPIRNSWLALEDIGETPDQIDRQVAQLKISGRLAQCAGLLVGDFHDGDINYSKDVVEILKAQLPKGNRIPIVLTEQVGHTWPIHPLPMCKRLTIRRTNQKSGNPLVEFEMPWKRWKIC